MKTILVTGAQGQLGQEFQVVGRKNHQFKFVYTDRSQIDLTLPKSLRFITELKPDLVINCAAYTAVDLAESEPDLALQVNALILKDLGAICHRLSIPIVHFSSDYVYHNYLRRPLRETDPTRPKGVYAKTKLKGEKLLLKHHSYPLIFRISWLYSSFGHNFPKTMLRLTKEKEMLTIVRDQIGAPTYARDVAEMVMHIVSTTKKKEDWQSQMGVFNYCNTSTTSWAGIAQHIVERTGNSCDILPIPSTKYPTPAPRPRYSVLNLAKFRRNFHLPIRHWKEGLDDCLDLLLNEKERSAVIK